MIRRAVTAPRSDRRHPGGAAGRIATLEQRVGEQRLVAERLARLEAQGEATAAAVERIDQRLRAEIRDDALEAVQGAEQPRLL